MKKEEVVGAYAMMQKLQRLELFALNLANKKAIWRTIVLEQDGLKNAVTLDQEQSDILMTAIVMMQNDLEERLKVMLEGK
jgi:hypothetical protein